MNIHRLIAIIKKEFIQMQRDRLTLMMMLALPLVQILLFGYAINTDVKHVKIAVVDYSNTEESRRLVPVLYQFHLFRHHFIPPIWRHCKTD